MRDEFKKDLIWSLLVHAALLGSIWLNRLYTTPAEGQPAGSDQKQESKEDANHAMDVEIVDPPSKEADSKLEVDSGEGAVAHASDQCPDSFGGIGVEIVILREGITILDAHPGYPAHEAGIEPGDVLLNYNELRGPVGTKVTVRIKRYGKPMTFNLIRDKICTKNMKGP